MDALYDAALAPLKKLMSKTTDHKDRRSWKQQWRLYLVHVVDLEHSKPTFFCYEGPF